MASAQRLSPSPRQHVSDLSKSSNTCCHSQLQAAQEASTGRRTSAAWVDPALTEPAQSSSTAQANGDSHASQPQSTAATITPTFSANPRGAGGGFGVTSLGDPAGSKQPAGAFSKLLSRIGLTGPEEAADGQASPLTQLRYLHCCRSHGFVYWCLSEHAGGFACLSPGPVAG